MLTSENIAYHRDPNCSPLRRHLQDHEKGDLPDVIPEHLDIWRKVREAKDEEIDRLGFQLDGAQNHIKELQTTINIRNRSIEAAKGREAAVEQKLKVVESEFGHCRLNKESASNRVNKAKVALETAQAERVKLDVQLKNTLAENEGLRAVIRIQEHTIKAAGSREDTIGRRFTEAEFEVARLRGIVGAQEKSKDVAVGRAYVKGRRLSEAEDKIIKLKEDLCEAEAELKDCQIAKGAVVARLSYGENEYQELLAINTSLEANLVDCQQKLKETESELGHCRLNKKDAMRLEDKANSTLKIAYAEKAQLYAKLEDTQNELGVCQTKKRKFQVDVFILQGELASCREELRDSRAVHEKTITQFSNFRKNISSRF